MDCFSFSCSSGVVELPLGGSGCIGEEKSFVRTRRRRRRRLLLFLLLPCWFVVVVRTAPAAAACSVFFLESSGLCDNDDETPSTSGGAKPALLRSSTPISDSNNNNNLMIYYYDRIVLVLSSWTEATSSELLMALGPFFFLSLLLRVSASDFGFGKKDGECHGNCLSLLIIDFLNLEWRAQNNARRGDAVTRRWIAPLG